MDNVVHELELNFAKNADSMIEVKGWKLCWWCIICCLYYFIDTKKKKKKEDSFGI